MGAMSRPALYALVLVLFVACSGRRLFYVRSELPILEGRFDLAIAPGPWTHSDVPVVVSDAADVPDDLVLPALKTLMLLPGAVDACDPTTKRPRLDAAEYCVAIYKTPNDWRVTWPVRNLMKEQSSCQPPFGGVDDEDYGREVPVIGFAHNHPCGTWMSSGHKEVPRFYKWNAEGRVFRWNEDKDHWEFQSVCRPRVSWDARPTNASSRMFP